MSTNEHDSAPAQAASTMDAKLRDDIGDLLCSIADNLGDMPISDEWAAKTERRARELLEANDYFRPIESAQAAQAPAGEKQ